MASQPVTTAAPVIEATTSPSLPQPIREVHILDRLVTVFRHMRLVVAVFSVVVAIGTLNSFSTVARYKAKASLLVQDPRSVAVTNLNSNNASQYYEDPEPYFNTQFQILRGRALGKRVVEKLDLVNRGIPSAQTTGVMGTISSARAKLSAGLRARLGGGTPANVPPPDPAQRETAQESAAIAAFLGGVEVIPVKTTRLVEVTYDSTDPQFAALAVNTLVNEYIEQNLDLRLRDIDNTLKWLEGQLQSAQAKLQAAEGAMADYRQQENALSLDRGTNIVGAQLVQLNDALGKARTVRIEKQAAYDQLKGLNGDSPEVEGIAAVSQNPAVQSIRSQLSALQSERARNADQRGPNHPEMIKLNSSIASLEEQLRAEKSKVIETIRNEYRSAVANEQSLTAALENQKRQSMDLDKKASGYTVLERQAAGEREIYQSLLTQDKELRVIRNSRANNIQLMDVAEVPKAPYVPDHRRDLLLSVVLGLALAVGIAFGIEYLDDTIKTPDDVTRRLNLPLLGLVPAVRGDSAPLLASDVPHDFGEAFRSLRTSLVFTSKGEGARLLGVTSTQPLEGKTTTACNLAMVLAYGGARVLLIDADMRRPGLHRTMGMPNEAGLSHVLTGQARIREVVRTTSEPNLVVITAGRTPPNPSELLAGDRMRELLQKLAHSPFDWVIIDTPPVLAVTDAVVLAPMLSGFTFVVGAEMTRRGHVERAVEMMQAARQPIVGVVLNRVDFDRNKYYYSRYYGYQYKSYYGQSQDPA
ncbi:MAG TPA: polysaccharide biosynthesis tyrosine autokinase [Vicinamibacterales bacterium]